MNTIEKKCSEKCFCLECQKKLLFQHSKIITETYYNFKHCIDCNELVIEPKTQNSHECLFTTCDNCYFLIINNLNNNHF